MYCRQVPERVVIDQDSASVHTGEHTQNYVMEDIMAILDSPARSSDLNPIENLWALLVRTAYARFRQFQNEEDLIEAIQYAWDTIGTRQFRTLFARCQRGAWQQLKRGEVRRGANRS